MGNNGLHPVISPVQTQQRQARADRHQDNKEPKRQK